MSAQREEWHFLSVAQQGESIVSPTTANTHSAPVDNASDNSTQTTEVEESMQAIDTNTATVIPADTSDVQAPTSAGFLDDPQPAVCDMDSLPDGQSVSSAPLHAGENGCPVPPPEGSVETLEHTDFVETTALATSTDGGSDSAADVGAVDQPPLTAGTGDNGAVSREKLPEDDEVVSYEADAISHVKDHPSVTRLPDPSSITDRLRNLVIAVGEVEELSRQAREVAASDLALYNGIAASRLQFDEGLAEARRIRQEAQAVYDRAFGRQAKAVAEPAVAEAREVQQAFAELAEAWRQQADTFLVEHPDVESLIKEERQRDDLVRRREVARAKSERFQQLVSAVDGALRQGLLDDARDCLKMLGREFPDEADRVAPLHERLNHRVRASNDAAARRVMFQASELQGRGDFDAAVKLLEAVEVERLSREASEDVFGRWSAACSLLGQERRLELVRYPDAQGRGLMLYRDPSVPYGMIVLSALGMGRDYFEGRVVSGTDRQGATIIRRAGPFRAAEPPADMSTGWYGRSYASTGSVAAEPVRH
jgi:hypothetical protein